MAVQHHAPTDRELVALAPAAERERSLACTRTAFGNGTGREVRLR